MRFVILSIVAGLAGCDLNEGPVEEQQEAEEALREGNRPGEVLDQMEDVKRDDVVVGDPDFDRDLRDAETWAERQRTGLADGTRKAEEGFDKALDDIQKDLKSIRADVDNMGDRADGDRDGAKRDLKDRLRGLSLKIDALDGEVNDRPGKDPVGPG